MDPSTKNEEERGKQTEPLMEGGKEATWNLQDIESVIGRIGLGRWQLVTSLIIAWTQLISGIINMLVIFMHFRPEFACRSAPVNQSENPCLVEANGTEFCQDFSFDTSVLSRSIISEWSLVCDRHFLAATATTVYMIGFLVGSGVCCPLADKIGRKISLYIYVLLLIGSLLMQGFATDYYVYLVARFINGVGAVSITIVPFVYVQEIVPSQYRTWLSGCFFTPYAVGYALVGPIFFWLPDWRHVCPLIAGLIAPVLFSWWWFLESPRFLITANRLKEAAKVLEIAAKRNGTSLGRQIEMNVLSPMKPTDEKMPETEESEQKAKIWVVFRSPKAAFRVLLIAGLWVVNIFVYYGVSLNMTAFSGNVFLNTSLAGILELPGYFLSALLLRVGRRPAQFLLLLITGVSLVGIPWMTNETMQVVTVLIGKTCVTGSFNVVYVFTGELFPTPLRSSGVGFCSMIGRIGGLVSPYVADISEFDESLRFLPMIIYGVLGLLGAVASLLLPETRNKPLGERIEDMLE